MPDSKVLGRNYPRVDAADKVSGRSQYASDIYLPGMLLCKVLKSCVSRSFAIKCTWYVYDRTAQYYQNI